MERFQDWLQLDGVRAALILLLSIVVAYSVEFVLRRTVLRLVRRTKTDLDDRIAAAMKGPIITSIVFAGALWSIALLDPTEHVAFLANATLKTVAVFIWTVALLRIGRALFDALGRQSKPVSVFAPQTAPLLDIIVKVLVISGAAYFTFLAWDVDVTAWLASAGIVGIAVGFAAQDSLANLFAGFFILADAPYKVGDWVVLDGALRGQVTQIGMRSTRIVTRDDIEITIPNSVMGSSKIINEAGGPHVKQRIRIAVSIAYGSDIDVAREALMNCSVDADGVCSDPEPRVRFRRFGESGLDFELLVWLEDPAQRGRVLDLLNTRVYRGLAVAGIEIPYNKLDVYVKEIAGKASEA